MNFPKEFLFFAATPWAPQGWATRRAKNTSPIDFQGGGGAADDGEIMGCDGMCQEGSVHQFSRFHHPCCAPSSPPPPTLTPTHPEHHHKPTAVMPMYELKIFPWQGPIHTLLTKQILTTEIKYHPPTPTHPLLSSLELKIS